MLPRERLPDLPVDSLRLAGLGIDTEFELHLARIELSWQTSEAEGAAVPPSAVKEVPLLKLASFSLQRHAGIYGSEFSFFYFRVLSLFISSLFLTS